MSQVITNPSPKARFQQSVDNIKKHRELVQLREFERACDYALLQHSADVVKQSDGNPQLSGAAFFKIQGAQEFLFALRNLSETVDLPNRGLTKVENLDHRS